MSSFQEHHRYPYSQAQINAYLTRISFPRAGSETAAAFFKPQDELHYLATLQKHHLKAVPFENLILHYSKEHTNSLNQHDLYEKIVTQGKGGYCFESNAFFGLMLRSLGFDVVSVGARVTIGGPDAGWDHQVNLVSIKGNSYLVDVAFGGSCPTRPMHLLHNHISRWGSTVAETRLTFRPPSNPIMQGLWALEHRISPTGEWKPGYTFTMTEFYPKDFEIMNFAIRCRQTSFWTYSIICMNMILDDKVDDIIGILVLEGGRLKRRIHAKSEVLMECTNEAERVDILDKYFGIKLSIAEQSGIIGTVTQL